MNASYDALRRGRNETPDTPRELAKWLIWPYVARGDSIQSLRQGSMGYLGTQGDVEIHLDHILVFRVGDREPGKTVDEIVRDRHVIARFRLRDLYCEVQAQLRTRTTQPSLFSAAESEVPA